MSHMLEPYRQACARAIAGANTDEAAKLALEQIEAEWSPKFRIWTESCEALAFGSTSGLDDARRAVKARAKSDGEAKPKHDEWLAEVERKNGGRHGNA